MNFCSSEINKTESVYARMCATGRLFRPPREVSPSLATKRGGGCLCKSTERYIIASSAPRIDRDIPPQRRERECHSRAWRTHTHTRTENPLPLCRSCWYLRCALTRRVCKAAAVAAKGATDRFPPSHPRRRRNFFPLAVYRIIYERCVH